MNFATAFEAIRLASMILIPAPPPRDSVLSIIPSGVSETAVVSTASATSGLIAVIAA